MDKYNLRCPDCSAHLEYKSPAIRYCPACTMEWDLEDLQAYYSVEQQHYRAERERIEAWNAKIRGNNH